MKELSNDELFNISAGGEVWKWFGKVAAYFANNYDAHMQDVYERAKNGEYIAD
ncbi:hypothetical protein [Aquiflexum sp.]|uniref:hypothetical protein n=1 Tax=Aquiflexum sp. TaxID=1872584 RepID=UPI00359350E4